MGNEKVDLNIIHLIDAMGKDLSSKITDSEGRISTQIKEAVLGANKRIDGHEIRLMDVERVQALQEGAAKGVSISAKVVYSLLLAAMTAIAIILSIKQYNHEVIKENTIRTEKTARD